MNRPTVTIDRWAAFTTTPEGGNPAGIVLDARSLTEAEMQALAREVGYAESAFVVAAPRGTDPVRVDLRYFSPVAEVPFCGHATVATAVALAESGAGNRFSFYTAAGEVRIQTERAAGRTVASFTSVAPWVASIDPAVLAHTLELLGLTPADLHSRYPAKLAFAGNVHPVLVLHDKATFDGLQFDPDELRALMKAQGWLGTLTVLHPLTPVEFEARNLFPVEVMTEDPATGSAAASTGAYLRALGGVAPNTRIRILQGRHVGRPSELIVTVPASGGITVSGSAVRIPV